MAHDTEWCEPCEKWVAKGHGAKKHKTNYLVQQNLKYLKSSGIPIKMPTKHKKMLEFTHEKGLGLLEDMNMLMFGFGPDAAAYKKKRAKKKKSCGCKHV